MPGRHSRRLTLGRGRAAWGRLCLGLLCYATLLYAAAVWRGGAWGDPPHLCAGGGGVWAHTSTRLRSTSSIAGAAAARIHACLPLPRLTPVAAVLVVQPVQPVESPLSDGHGL